METVREFIFWAPKSLQMVTAAMKLKHGLLLERKAMINLGSILKSRDITLPTKVHLVKVMFFPVVKWLKVIILKTLFFHSSFRFITKLRGEYKDFPYSSATTHA